MNVRFNHVCVLPSSSSFPLQDTAGGDQIKCTTTYKCSIIYHLCTQQHKYSANTPHQIFKAQYRQKHAWEPEFQKLACNFKQEFLLIHKHIKERSDVKLKMLQSCQAPNWHFFERSQRGKLQYRESNPGNENRHPVRCPPLPRQKAVELDTGLRNRWQQCQDSVLLHAKIGYQ